MNGKRLSKARTNILNNLIPSGDAGIKPYLLVPEYGVPSYLIPLGN